MGAENYRPDASLEQSYKIDGYQVRLKEALLELARRDVMSAHDLEKYMPLVFIQFLEDNGVLEEKEFKTFADPMPHLGPNKYHVYACMMYSLTNKGASITNTLTEAPILVRVKSKGVFYTPKERIKFEAGMTAGSIGFGSMHVIPDETLEEILMIKKQK